MCRRITVYPFERFTERVKKVLTLAQEEAERSHHSYIGTEHLLLGLLCEHEGLAAQVLANLGVDIDTVREIIRSVLGRNERIIIQQIIPTSRDLAFQLCTTEGSTLSNASVTVGIISLTYALDA